MAIDNRKFEEIATNVDMMLKLNIIALTSGGASPSQLQAMMLYYLEISLDFLLTAMRTNEELGPQHLRLTAEDIIALEEFPEALDTAMRDVTAIREHYKQLLPKVRDRLTDKVVSINKRV